MFLFKVFYLHHNLFFFFTKSLTLDILFSTVVRAVAVAKLVILDILFLVSFISEPREALVAKLVISGKF